MKLSDYRKISPAMNAELKSVFEKFGFDTRQLRASIDERIGIVKLSIELGDKGQTVSPDALYYTEFCRQMGEFTELRPEWLNRDFRIGGENYRLVGMKARGKNRMMILRLRDNSLRVTTEEQVALFFGRAGIHPAENVGSTTDQASDAQWLGELLGK